MPTLTGAQGIESDDFYTGSFSGLSPDPGWAELDAAQGDYSFTGDHTNDARLVMSIPQGAERYLDGPEGTSAAYYIMQNSTNGNFVLQTKIDVLLTLRDTECGICVQNTAGTQRVVLGVYLYGATPAQHVYAAYRNGTSWVYTWPDATPPNPVFSVPYYLRMTRVTNAWTFEYGTNPASLTVLASGQTTTPSALTIDKVGLYIANFWNGSANNAAAPAFDYFFENSAPITQEDQAPGASRRIFIIS